MLVWLPNFGALVIVLRSLECSKRSSLREVPKNFPGSFMERFQWLYKEIINGDFEWRATHNRTFVTPQELYTTGSVAVTRYKFDSIQFSTRLYFPLKSLRFHYLLYIFIFSFTLFVLLNGINNIMTAFGV